MDQRIEVQLLKDASFARKPDLYTTHL